MIFALLAESTLRSMVLFAAVWLLLKAVRLSDLRVEKRIWTGVVLVSLAMPILTQTLALPIPAPALPLQSVGRLEILIAAQSSPHRLVQLVRDSYLLVAAVLLARLAMGLWAAARLRHAARRLSMNLPEPVDVRSSANLRAPSSFGSTILLPVGWELWDAPKLAAVLAHERAHIREHDCWRIWLASFYGALFWFNPCAFWLRRRLILLAELISDETAIAEVGNRLGYAEMLINLAADAQMPTVTVGMALPSTLTPRLKRLLESDMSPTNLRLSRKMLLMSAVMLTAATAACAATAPLVLTEAQDSAVNWVAGEPLGNFYPKALQKRGVQGQVVCRVTIDAAGRVKKVVVVKADESHPELTIAAENAVKTFRFNNTLLRPVIKTMAVRFVLS